jgi:hypothetical protein
MDAKESLDRLQGHGLVAQERADEICAAWGVPPMKADVKLDSEAEWELSLAEHLCRELGLDSRSGLRGRGYQCGELVARLLVYLEEKEKGS